VAQKGNTSEKSQPVCRIAAHHRLDRSPQTAEFVNLTFDSRQREFRVVPGCEMATGGTRRRHAKKGSEFNAGALTVSILMACITAKCCASPPLSRGIDPPTLASEERDELHFVYNRTNVSIVYNRKFTEWCTAGESLSWVFSSDRPANAFPGTAYADPGVAERTTHTDGSQLANGHDAFINGLSDHLGVNRGPPLLWFPRTAERPGSKR
jgi:hypothetical protein